MNILKRTLPLLALLPLAVMGQVDGTTGASQMASVQRKPRPSADTLYTTVAFDNTHSTVPYRIPAMVQRKDGTVLALADYRYNHSDIGWLNHGTRRLDVRLRFSTDRGHTWSDSITTVARSNGIEGDAHVAFGDPSVVADREHDNEVLVHCVGGNVSYGQATREHPQHAWFFRSHDGGLTWDGGTDLTEQIHRLYDNRLPGGGCPDGIFLTSGKITQSSIIKRGQWYRLYMAHPVRQQNVGRCGTFVIYSDDFGQTWHTLGNPSTAPSIAQDESKVEELPDGSVLLSCRDVQQGRRFNVFTYSNKECSEGSWGEEVMPDTLAGVAACNGDILVVPARRMDNGRKTWLIIQSCNQAPTRVQLGFYYKEIASRSDVATAEALGSGWHKGYQLVAGSSAYSTMTLLDNRTIGILYEADFQNDGFDIRFSSLPIDLITGGQYTSCKGRPAWK